MSETAAAARDPWAKLWGQPYPLLILTSLFWSGNMIVGRVAPGDVPPVALTLIRWTLALLLLLPFAWRPLVADRRALLAGWKPLLALSVFGIAGYNALAYTGLKTTTAVNAGLLQAVSTPFTVLFAFLFLAERPSGRVLVGMTISILGALAVVSQGHAETLLRLRLNPGDAFLIAAIASYAVYTVWLHKAPKVHPLSLLAVIFTIGSLILVPFAIVEAASGERIRWGVPAAACIAYVAVFPSLIAYFFFNRGVELVGAAKASLFGYLIPVFAAAMAVAFLGEHLLPHHYLGAALIAIGTIVGARRGGDA